MTENDDLEARLLSALRILEGREVSHARLDGEVLVVQLDGARIRLQPPWRIVVAGDIVVGSRDVARVGLHRQRLSELGARCQKIVGRKATAFEILDFEITLGDGASVEHFGCSTSDLEDDYVFTLEWDDGTGFKLGHGWIEPLGE